MSRSDSPQYALPLQAKSCCHSSSRLRRVSQVIQLRHSRSEARHQPRPVPLGTALRVAVRLILLTLDYCQHCPPQGLWMPRIPRCYPRRDLWELGMVGVGRTFCRKKLRTTLQARSTVMYGHAFSDFCHSRLAPCSATRIRSHMVRHRKRKRRCCSPFSSIYRGTCTGFDEPRYHKAP